MLGFSAAVVVAVAVVVAAVGSRLQLEREMLLPGDGGELMELTVERLGSRRRSARGMV